VQELNSEMLDLQLFGLPLQLLVDGFVIKYKLGSQISVG
jgi:hypothetical protein